MAVAYNVVTEGAANALPERAVLRVCLSRAAARLAFLALVLEAAFFFRGVFCNLASVMSPCRCGFRRALLRLLLFLLVVGTWRVRSASLVGLDRLMVAGSLGGYSVRGIR